ncbi:MAG: HEPN domain-containing protein [Deltaproteobacteria bacterium]|nr:HEPN domain-containing protein [Deltaproteobacteria bacterium]
MAENRQTALASHRMDKARARLDSAEKDFLADRHGDSITHSYYAAFTATRALLALLELDSRKHSGVIALFNEHYIKTGKLPREMFVVLREAKNRRESSDYADYVEICRDEAESLLKGQKSLCAR